MSENSEGGSCCPPGSIGEAAPPKDYIPKGEEIVLDDKLTVYVVGPKKPTDKAILVLHDIFGPNSGRTKQICDEYSEKGYFVCLPYLLRCEPLQEATGWKKFLGLFPAIFWVRKNRWSEIGTLVNDLTIPYLKEQGIKQAGIACFCWGCYPMVHTLSQQDPLFKCGVGFHPSLQTFIGLFEDSGKVLQGIQTPIMMLSAGNDPGDIKPNGSCDKTFQSKDVYSECVFKEYVDMIHGWVNRGDLGDETIKRDYEDAMNISDDFFAKYLK